MHGRFKILQITDLNYGYNELNDIKTTEIVYNLIDMERPDLVVLTGDIVKGDAWDKTLGWYKK